MSTTVISVQENTSVESVARLMLSRDVDHVLVLDRTERLCGIITESDFMAKERNLPFSPERRIHLLGEWVTKRGMEAIYASAGSKTADQIMSAPVITVGERTPIGDVLHLMHRRQIAHVPVLHGGRTVGVLSRHDLLKLVLHPPALTWYPGAEEGRTVAIAVDLQRIVEQQDLPPPSNGA